MSGLDTAAQIIKAQQKVERLRGKFADAQQELNALKNKQVYTDPKFGYFMFNCRYKRNGSGVVRTYRYVGFRVGDRVYLTGSETPNFTNWTAFVDYCQDKFAHMSNIVELNPSLVTTPSVVRG